MTPLVQSAAEAAPHAATYATHAVQAAATPVQDIEMRPMAPPLIAALTGLVVLVADLFLPRRRKGVLAVVSAVGLVAAIVPLAGLSVDQDETFCLHASPLHTQQCSYEADGFSVTVQFLVFAAALVTVLLSASTVRQQRLPAGEYWFLLLSATAGAALVPASRDLVSLVIALEVASLPAFALVGLRRGSRQSAEAALKFFLTSVTATAVTLLGVSFLYAATGTLDLYGISTHLHHVDPRLHSLTTAALVLTFAGFAVKAAVVPFHFWVPDSYVGAPIPVAAFLSVVSKTAGLSGLVLLLVHAFANEAAVWGPIVGVLAVATMSVGNAAAVRQRADRPHSAVRLLAWSSVGQAGYLLVPLAAAAPYVAGEREEALTTIGATVSYLLMYAVVNLGAFAVVAHVGRITRENRLADYRGLYRAHPLAAAALAFFLLCLAGLPPGFIGLFAKIAILHTAVANGMTWLAVFMALNVVVALYYYLRWAALLFQPAPRPGPAGEGTHGGGASAKPVGGVLTGGGLPAPALDGGVRVSRSLRACIALTATAAVLLSIFPDPVLTYAAVGFL